MNRVAELKQFALLHARAQRIRRPRRVLDRITNDEPEQPGSWAREWFEEAERLRARGRLNMAVTHYNMARFPYADDPVRVRARQRCVHVFGQWAAKHDVRPVELPLLGERVRCWTSGLSEREPRPLVLLCGGIISSKEQWAPALIALRRFGMAGVVLEMPGVGENPLRYQQESWQLFPAILDALDGRAEVDRSCAMAMSFSGHLALRAAGADDRFRGIVTAGVPVREFFRDTDRQAKLPGITRRTLEHLTGADLADLAPWALSHSQLRAVTAEVSCTASSRDEIIPAADLGVLRAEIRHLRLVEHDDVHGSPHHVAQTRLWTLLSVLHALDAPPLPSLALRGAVTAIRTVDRLRATA